MPLNAHSLITISNNTTFRDFSQGLYRMRNIKESQTFDIIMTENSFNIGIKNEPHTQNFINMMEQNQDIDDKFKKKMLYKQNIFALSKKNSDEIKNFEIILYENILKQDTIININNENIEIAIGNAIGIKKELCERIYNDYKLMSNIEMKQSISQQQQLQQQKQKVETFSLQSLSSNQNITQLLSSIQESNYNIKYIDNKNIIIKDDDTKLNNDDNNIIILCKTASLIYALYNCDNKILYLVDKIYLYKIINFINNDNILFFDYFSNIIYGKCNITDYNKLYIFTIIKSTIIKYKNELNYLAYDIFFTPDELNFSSKLNTGSISIINTFKNIFFINNPDNKFRKKYLKYKQKYLNLL